MEQIKRQMSQTTSEGQDVPEWVRLHEQKKSLSSGTKYDLMCSVNSKLCGDSISGSGVTLL